jgi:RNA polymerase sigma-70 factor (ECF subfamily)
MNGSDVLGGVDPGSTASSLVAGVKALDPLAWRRLTTLYGPLVYGWARRAGLRGEDAADITQEVFRAVAARAPQLRHDRPGDTFRGWLWTVTRNKIRDFHRGRAGDPSAVGGTDAQNLLLLVAEHDDSSSSSPPPGSQGVLRRAIEMVRAEFEDRSWQAFWAVTVDGRPAADVASDLGITPNAVYVARSRILRRLRELLAGGAIDSSSTSDRPTRG